MAFATAFAVLVAIADPALARRDPPTIIRDAELENIIRRISVPLFEAAGLDAGAVRTYIVRDNTLNAFVAGGQNVFVNTGLIMAADNVNQLVGVLAHETGHISGGHLARFQDGLKGASATSIISMLLGAAAIASGAGDAGMAILLGGQEAAQRAVLAYSRTQEAAADQAAMQFLNKTGQSGRGLVDFFERLGDQELLYTTNQDPYVRSHPLTRDRINALKDQVEESPYADAPNPDDFDDLFERMKAKLVGYFQPPRATFAKYPEHDKSLYARYARAYAYHQDHDVEKALAEIDSLLAEYPDDPYFWEARGFILFENGMISQAIEP
ncbi:MAG: M48 family peptidase, partial [Alphaproteobacteria bacterium]